jgi:DHA3 family macrolide efflux protein-like MFS transporter
VLLLQALKNKSISLLWTGQVLSSIGDEVYRVAFVWLAVGIIGAKTGYLSALQFGAVLLVSLFGGKWSDHWDHFRTLIWVDLLRGVLILLPVVASFFFPFSLPLLCIASIFIAGLSGFFDPALQSILPRYAENARTLQAANGLMSTTIRSARVLGPLIIGALTAILPTKHFFTLDSLSFFASAFTLRQLLKHKPAREMAPHHFERTGLKKSLMAGFKLVKKYPNVARGLFIKSLTGGAWQFSYGLGIALLVRERVSQEVSAFGLVMGAYGIGNLVAALVVGSIERKNPERAMYWGFTSLGVGFIALAYAPTLPWLMLAAAFAAIGGPLNDTPFSDLVQERFELHELTRVFRLRLACETFFILLFLLAAPVLLIYLHVSTLIRLCGTLMLILGIYGHLRVEPRQNCDAHSPR